MFSTHVQWMCVGSIACERVLATVLECGRRLIDRPSDYMAGSWLLISVLPRQTAHCTSIVWTRRLHTVHSRAQAVGRRLQHTGRSPRGAGNTLPAAHSTWALRAQFKQSKPLFQPHNVCDQPVCLESRAITNSLLRSQTVHLKTQHSTNLSIFSLLSEQSTYTQTCLGL